MLSIKRLKATPDTWVFSLKGSVDSSNVDELQEAFDAAFDEKVYRIVVDLAEIEFVASSGFSCFLTSRDRATENCGDIVFSAARIQVREIFTLMGLEDILRFFVDVPSALQHFRQASTAAAKPA